MLEATRLTREGKLTEASALLQRLFRGEVPASASMSTARNTAASPGERHPRLFDVDPETGEAAGVTPPPGPHGRMAGRWSTGGVDTATKAADARSTAWLLDQISQGRLAKGLGGLGHGSMRGR
jgi:hypothetical protein